MGYIENFRRMLLIASTSNEYVDAISEWVFDGESFKSEYSCICGHPIVQNMVVHNNINNNQLIVGNCCIHKFGIHRDHYNKSPSAYLEYALRRTRTDDDKAFVEKLQSKKDIFSSLWMLPEQKQRLEALTGKEYRWKWESPYMIELCSHYTTSGHPAFKPVCPLGGRAGLWCHRSDVPHYCGKYIVNENEAEGG